MRIAIVLAGGRSSRFGGDKLSAELDGSSLLGSAMEAVARVADRLIVAGRSLPAGATPLGVPVELVRDIEVFPGPLAALGTVLAGGSFGEDDLAIVVGGDMPRLVPAVLRAMLDRLAADPAADAVFLGQEGPRAVLPLALRVTAARHAAEAAIGSGERSLQALVDRLAHVEVPAATWQLLDPARDTLLDVDAREDLDRIGGS